MTFKQKKERQRERGSVGGLACLNISTGLRLHEVRLSGIFHDDLASLPWSIDADQQVESQMMIQSENSIHTLLDFCMIDGY